jgi:hypothetical protein
MPAVIILSELQLIQYALSACQPTWDLLVRTDLLNKIRIPDSQLVGPN